MDVVAVAVRAFRQIRPGRHLLSAVVTVPHRDTVTPPDLAGNAPVMDVVHPVRIGLRETVRHKLDAPVFNAFHGGLHEGFHFDKPLRGNKGFHDVVAALAVTDSMGRPA